MDDPSRFGGHGLFQFDLLPMEVRCRIYYFAIVEPHPLRLIARSGKRLNGHVQIYGVEKDLRMLETNSEFLTEMKRMLYSGNSFWFSVSKDDLEEETKLFKVDPSQIEKFHLWIDKMSDPEEDNEYYPDVFNFHLLVESLHLKGHRMKYLLVECEDQLEEALARGLFPLTMLRKICLVHFRSSEAEMYHYFRCLEDVMMSDQPVLPFDSLEDFWEQQRGSDKLLEDPESWFEEDLAIMDKSEEQMEATAKELHSILRIEHDFVPQSELV